MGRAGDGPGRVTGARRETQLFLIAGLVAAVGLALWAVGLWWNSEYEFSDGSAVSDRREVLREAEDFAVAYGNWNIQEAEDFEARIDDLVTNEFAQTTLGPFARTMSVGAETFGAEFTQESIFRSAAVLEYSEDAATVLVVLTPEQDPDVEAVDLESVSAAMTEEQRDEVRDKYAGQTDGDLADVDIALLSYLDFLQSMTTAAVPAVTIDLVRTDDEWLVSGLEFERYAPVPDAEAVEDRMAPEPPEGGAG